MRFIFRLASFVFHFFTAQFTFFGQIGAIIVNIHWIVFFFCFRRRRRRCSCLIECRLATKVSIVSYYLLVIAYRIKPSFVSNKIQINDWKINS